MTEAVRTFTLTLAGEADTIRLGEDLALALKPGDCLALSGNLGAGKSTLARAFLRAMANDPYLEAPSPTFTLVQSYELRLPVAHFDLYRIADPSELDELGLDEALDHGVALIEWPEMAGDVLPKTAISLKLEQDGEGRRATIVAREPQAGRIARNLLVRAFLNDHGHAGAARRHLTGDASTRAYEYVIDADKPRLILMDTPRQPDGPPIRDGKPYSQIAHLAEDVYPFVAIARTLRAQGLAAPEIYDGDYEAGILLIEDLGTEGVLDSDRKPIPERYRESVACLAHLHSMQFPRQIRVTDAHVHTIPDYDATVMKMEAELTLDWHLPWKRNGKGASDEERAEYLAIWDGLIAELADAETNLVLRDFHSPNIIWRPEASGIDRVGLIDFQDAMIGPTAYDLVSIVQDARVTIERDLVDVMMADYMALRHAQSANETSGFDEANFRKAWAIMAAQRACKLNGLWVRLWKRDGKDGYMKHMPRTLWHLQVAFEHEALALLREWCARAGIGAVES